jgi:transcriptional regulator with XRE-family HTH domain
MYYVYIPNQGGDYDMSNLGNKEIFAKILAFYLSRSGKDQKEVADAVGVAPSTFNEWMKAKKYPRIDKIEFMANYFGILKSDLIEEAEDKKISPDELQLTEGEKALIKLLRRVPAAEQPIVIEKILSALDNQE